MKGKFVSGIMLTLLLTSMLTMAFKIQSVKANGTIHIRSDGSIDPLSNCLKTNTKTEQQIASSDMGAPLYTPIMGTSGIVPARAAHTQNHWWILDYWDTWSGESLPSWMTGEFTAEDDTFVGLQSGWDWLTPWFDSILYLPLNVAYGNSNTNCVWFQFDIQFVNPGMWWPFPGAINWYIWDIEGPATNDSDYKCTSIGIPYVVDDDYVFSLTPSGSSTITFSITDQTTGASWSKNTWDWPIPSTNLLAQESMFSPSSCVEGYTTGSSLSGTPFLETKVGSPITVDRYYSHGDPIPSGITTDRIPLGTYDLWYWMMLYPGARPVPSVITPPMYPSTITLGESATIEVNATNNGGTASSQTIAISFPFGEPINGISIVQSDLANYGVHSPGETVMAAYGATSVSLANYLVEGSADWPQGVYHYLIISVQPLRSGPFVFYVKSVATARSSPNNWDPQIGTEDGQLEFVYNYTITVSARAPETLKVPSEYATIQGAVNAAFYGDTIQVAQGTYYENVVVNKSITLSGENPETAIIDGSGVGDVVRVTADNATVMGFNIRNSASNCSGVVLDRVWNCNVTGNNLVDNGEYGVAMYCAHYDPSSGLVFRPCFNDSIVGNNITNSSLAVEAFALYGAGAGGLLCYCYDNTISRNNITNCTSGIYIDLCRNNTITENSVVGGINLPACTESVISENSIKGGISICPQWIHANFVAFPSSNTIYGNYIANSSCGISLVITSNTSIVGNNISSNLNGIWLDGSSGNSISGNSIVANNGYGVAFDWTNYMMYNITSDENTVSENRISGNLVGVWLNSSSSNRIFHNCFAQNSIQARVDSLSLNNSWDDGYPSGGNYWSDYTGVDVKSSPYQNETGSDGIGDTPYVIGTNNLDYYPLMNPWTLPDIAVTNLTSAKTVIGQGCTGSVNVTFANLGSKIEAFSATVYVNSTCIYSEQVMLAMTNCTLSFDWNTTGFAMGNYTTSAYAAPVSGETNTVNNNFTGGWIYVSIIGDITGGTPNALDFVPDGKVDMKDIGAVAKFFPQKVPPAPSDCDVSGPTRSVPDGIIDMHDVGLVCRHFNEHYP